MRQIVLIMALIIAIPALAGQAGQEMFSLSFAELMAVKVSGATLTPEDIKAVPSAVTVFSHEEIQRLGLDTLGELMSLVPGFQSYQSSESALYRPASTRARRIGLSASEILIVLDGQRLNTPRSSGSTQIVSNRPLVNIERVEFIRGPGAALYGSNAMLGVINIVTRSGQADLGLAYGSFDRLQAYVLASPQFGELSVDLFALADTDDGDRYQVQDTYSAARIYTEDPTTRYNLNLKLNWSNSYLNLQYERSETDDFYQLAALSNGVNQNTLEQKFVSFRQDFDWRSINSYIWLSYLSADSHIASQLTAPGDLFLASGGASHDALFGEVEFDDNSEARFLWHNDWTIGDQSSLQFGGEYRHIDSPEIIASNNFDLGDLANGDFPIRYYGTLVASTRVLLASKRDIVGLYGQYQRQLFEASRLVVGLRYDDFSGIGSELSPRLAWIQQVTEQHTLKLLYGGAFRAPAEDELNLVNNPSVLGNPDLEPETTESWELIWLGHWAHTSTSLGYFDTRFEDSIIQTSIGGGTRQYQNADQDPIKGFEFELSHEFNQNWLLRASYTHITDKPALSYREADHFGSLMVNYQYQHWNANVIASYYDKREMPTQGSDDQRIELDSYWQLFAKLSYKFSPALQGYVQAKNLADNDYLTPAISASLTEGIPNRGQEILAGLIWRF